MSHQRYTDVEISQLICRANQMTGFYMSVTLSQCGLKDCVSIYLWKCFERNHCFYRPIRVFKKQRFSLVCFSYRDNLGIKAEDVKGYFVPEFLMKKMKLWMKRKSIWDKVFKNGPSEICGRQPLKNLKWYGLLKHGFFLISFLISFSSFSSFL